MVGTGMMFLDLSQVSEKSSLPKGGWSAATPYACVPKSTQCGHVFRADQKRADLGSKLFTYVGDERLPQKICRPFFHAVHTRRVTVGKDQAGDVY